MKQIKNCKEDVFLETEEDDSLNLKSVLSQYVFIVLAGQEELMKHARVVCRGEKDYQVLAEYLSA